MWYFVFLCTLIIIIYVNIYRERESKCKMTKRMNYLVFCFLFFCFVFVNIYRESERKITMMIPTEGN